MKICVEAFQDPIYTCKERDFDFELAGKVAGPPPRGGRRRGAAGRRRGRPALLHQHSQSLSSFLSITP
jgi:hypothetical protein